MPKSKSAKPKMAKSASSRSGKMSRIMKSAAKLRKGGMTPSQALKAAWKKG